MADKPLPQDFAESVAGHQANETREQRIYAMLDNAVENRYDFSVWTVEDIIADLLVFADLNDDEAEDEIRPHVITWKQKRSGVT